MARKYSTLVFENEAEARRIISEAKPSLQFLDISYVRDDRVVDLKTNTVLIGEHCQSNYSNTEHFYKHGGTVAKDKISNAYLNDVNEIVGKEVTVNMDDDGKIHIRVEETVLANLDRGYFNFVDMDIDKFILELRQVVGCEWICDEIEVVYNHYKIPNTSSWYLRMWYLINHYNLFDLLDQYSNLFTYYEELYVRDQVGSFFEVACLPNEFLFRLTNYYLGVKTLRYNNISDLTTNSSLWKFYISLPAECQTVFLEEAEKERFDIMKLNLYSYEKDYIISIAKEHPLFFNEYLQKVDTTKIRTSILDQMLNDVKNLENNGLSIKFENISRSALSSKAKAMNLELSDFLTLVDGLNTKQGILKYLMAAKKTE